MNTLALNATTSKVVNVVEKKRDKNITRDIVNYVLSKKNAFTIQDIYQQFPGKDSAVQLVIAVINLAGLLQKIKRAEYRVATDKLSSEMFNSFQDVIKENNLLRKNNMRMSDDLNQVLEEVDEIRKNNISNSNIRIQLQKLQIENDALRNENSRLKGVRHIHAV